jgi:hypothetical protein
LSCTLLLAALFTVLAACNSNGGSSGGSTGSAFRNLGKRGDSNFSAVNAVPAAH